MRLISILGALSLSAAAAENSGRASAGWISSSASCEPGTTLRTAIRLVVDDGWHTYWINPGAAGMKPSIEWELPAGWTASGLEFPVPERFNTGELPGFGYEGTVLFPVSVTPPADFEGEATLAGRMSWLACNDSGCVPGEARLTLVLTAGTPVPSDEAPAILAALRKIPGTAEKALRLSVLEDSASLRLSLEPQPGKAMDLGAYEAFPATPEVIDPAAVIRFTRNGDRWTTEVPKSEYATSPVKQLSLVLAGKNDEPSLQLDWKSP